MAGQGPLSAPRQSLNIHEQSCGNPPRRDAVRRAPDTCTIVVAHRRVVVNGNCWKDVIERPTVEAAADFHCSEQLLRLRCPALFALKSARNPGTVPFIQGIRFSFDAHHDISPFHHSQLAFNWFLRRPLFRAFDIYFLRKPDVPSQRRCNNPLQPGHGIPRRLCSCHLDCERSCALPRKELRILPSNILPRVEGRAYELGETGRVSRGTLCFR